MDLRHAAQRVRILDLVVRPVMRLLQRGPTEEVTQLRGHRELPGVRPGQLILGGERDVRALQRFDAHRRGHARGPAKSLRIGQQQRADGAHHLGPVEEGQALLRLEPQRLQSRFAEGDEGGHDVAVSLDLSPTDQRQGQVGQRRQVAGCPDAPLLRHDRMQATRQELQDPIDQQWPAPGVAKGQRVCPEQQHRPDHVPRERRAHAGRVRHQEVLLEPLRILGGDDGRGQRAEPGRDAIHDLPGADELLDDRPGLLHPAPGVDVERCFGTVAGDGFDVLDGQVGAGQDDGVGGRGRVAATRREVDLATSHRDLRLGHPPRIVG